jgi:flagellar biogenesis protein FliO
MARRLAVTGVAVAAIALTPWLAPDAARAEAAPATSAAASGAPSANSSANASAATSASAQAATAATAAPVATAAAVPTAPATTSAPVAAATGATPLTVRPTHPVTFASDPGHLGVGWKLALIGLALGGGFWFWKRRAPAGATPAPKIRIVARQAVGVRSEILIVEIEGDRLLLGVTPQNIARIGDLPPEAYREVEGDTTPISDARDLRDERDARAPREPRDSRSESDFALRTGVSAYAREQTRDVSRDDRDERDVRTPRSSAGRDVSARISALLGNPQLEPAPVITARGASRGRAARTAVPREEARPVSDSRVELDANEPAPVEAQARGLLRAARRP